MTVPSQVYHSHHLLVSVAVTRQCFLATQVRFQLWSEGNRSSVQARTLPGMEENRPQYNELKNQLQKLSWHTCAVKGRTDGITKYRTGALDRS